MGGDIVSIAFASGQEPVTLPCPFCGETSLVFSQITGGNSFVECNAKKCPAQPMTIGKTMDKAIDNWNTRVSDEMASEAYTLRWLRQEAKDAGWDLLDLVEAATQKKIARILPAKMAPPVRYNEDGF